MSKRGQLLLIVQTTMLANSASVSLQPELAEVDQEEYSAVGVRKLRREVVAAGERASNEMTAADGATMLCCKLHHLRDARETAGEMTPVPHWLAHG